MDTLLHDSTLQILLRTDTQTLAALLPQFPSEVREKVNTPLFWGERLKISSPEAYHLIPHFEQAYQLAPPVDLEVMGRMVEYCKMHDCHPVAAALALHHFPSLDVITAALALIQGELLMVNYQDMETHVSLIHPETLTRKEQDSEVLEIIERLDPTSPKDDLALVRAMLDCCEHQSQHLAQIFAYVWRFNVTSPQALALLAAGLERHFDKLVIALDIMLQLKAYHPWRIMVENFIYRFVDLKGPEVRFIPAMIDYALSYHQYHILSNSVVNSTRMRNMRVVSDFLRKIDKDLPAFVFHMADHNYQDDCLDFPLPPVYCQKIYPEPLIAERARLSAGQSLYEYYRAANPSGSIFAYTASQLIEMLNDGVDLLGLLNDEVGQNFPHNPEEINFSGTLVLYNLANEYDPRMARVVFGGDGFKNWVARNEDEWQNAAAIKRLFEELGLL